jgi:hypothetical protein
MASWRGPRRTWPSRTATRPAPGGDWTPLQIRFLLWWYAVDASGRFLYDRAQIVLPKGSGKSPLAAAIGCCELGAEVLYDGRDAAGNPVGRPQPSPWVQLAAVSEDQTTNTMSLVIAMLREGRANETVPGLDTGLTRIFTANGKLEPVTASAPSREGQRLTAAVLDEPHLWLPSNGGIRLAATIRRNLAKMGGRSIETTNAWRDGEDSVAEATSRYADLAREGKTRNARILRMHPTATVPDLADEDSLRAGLTSLYADMPWIDIDRIVAEVYDPNTDPGDARRFYLNEITSADDALVTASQWDACKVDARLADGDVVRSASTVAARMTRLRWSPFVSLTGCSSRSASGSPPGAVPAGRSTANSSTRRLRARFCGSTSSGSTPTWRCGSPTSTAGRRSTASICASRRRTRPRWAGTCGAGCKSRGSQS